MAGNPLGAEIAQRVRRRDQLRLVAHRGVGADAAPMACCRLLQDHLAGGHACLTRQRRPAGPGGAGPLSRDQKIVAFTFVGMVGLWARADPRSRFDGRCVPGSGDPAATGVLTPADIAKEGDVLATFIWFAALFTLSGQLNEMGFMGFLGERLACAWRAVSARTAWRSSRLRPAPLSLREPDRARAGPVRGVSGRGCEARRAGVPLAFMLLFASNFFSVIAPQGSSANLLFTGSGYFTQAELYRLGAITTASPFSSISWLRHRG